jgi:hypothetical protein
VYLDFILDVLTAPTGMTTDDWAAILAHRDRSLTAEPCAVTSQR